MTFPLMPDQTAPRYIVFIAVEPRQEPSRKGLGSSLTSRARYSERAALENGSYSVLSYGEGVRRLYR